MVPLDHLSVLHLDVRVEVLVLVLILVLARVILRVCGLLYRIIN
jgi:hypothetical protein